MTVLCHPKHLGHRKPRNCENPFPVKPRRRRTQIFVLKSLWTVYKLQMFKVKVSTVKVKSQRDITYQR